MHQEPRFLWWGGIQGDEPGGFNAATLLTTHYKILSGRAIVVPNLNFSSIVKRSRGIHGDMNRKFDTLTPGDPESETIVRIKSRIQDPNVDVILNLHDGSGFYAKTHINRQLTRLWPQYFEYARGLEGIIMVVDGQEQSIVFGSVVSVKDRFLVKHIPDHRVNIIGVTRHKAPNESCFVVRQKNFAKQFSMDKAGRIFRVEVYESKKFNGMVLVDFRPGNGVVELVDRGKKPGGEKQFYQ